MDVLESVNSRISDHLFSDTDGKRCTNSVRKRSNCRGAKGEFSFQVRLIHERLVKEYADDTGLEARRRIDELIEKSKNWIIPIANYDIQGDRCILFLQRIHAIEYALKSIETSELFSSLKASVAVRQFYIEVVNVQESSDLATLRASLVSLSLKNILKYFMNYNESGDEYDLLLEVRPIFYKNVSCRRNAVSIYTGIAIDNENKRTAVSVEEYMRIRAKDMQLMAMHKYGVRVKDENSLKKLILQLGDAAVKFDLLETKHTSPVLVKTSGQGCTKGAAFILYNSARIETLLRKFENNIEKGVYPKLPNLEDIDIHLLKEEEEWSLVFNYILSFPSMIKRCVEGIEEGKYSIHLLIQFMFGLVSLFSVYYRRIRVLLDGPDHLTPLVHARIYLIRCIQTILNRSLAIINVDPIQRM